MARCPKCYREYDGAICIRCGYHHKTSDFDGCGCLALSAIVLFLIIGLFTIVQHGCSTGEWFTKFDPSKIGTIKGK